MGKSEQKIEVFLLSTFSFRKKSPDTDKRQRKTMATTAAKNSYFVPPPPLE